MQRTKILIKNTRPPLCSDTPPRAFSSGHCWGRISLFWPWMTFPMHLTGEGVASCCPPTHSLIKDAEVWHKPCCRLKLDTWEVSMWIGFGKQTVGNYFDAYFESLNCFKIGNKKNCCYLTTEREEKSKETHLSLPNNCQELWISLGM